MTEDFPRILRFTLAWECGHNPKNPRGNVDNPLDHGGRTSRGITQRTYDGVGQAHGWPPGDVWEAPDAQVEFIYRTRFWNRVLGDAVPWPLCGALFDSYVLHRMEPIIKRLQHLVAVPEDGTLGPTTIQACGNLGWVNAAWLLLQQRDDRYEAIVGRDGTQGAFYKGWEARLDALTDFLGLPRTLG